MPPQQRAPVIRAYLQRSGRQPGSKAAASEARYYFGVTADPSLEELSQIATHYPVFQILHDARQPAVHRTADSAPLRRFSFHFRSRPSSPRRGRTPGPARPGPASQVGGMFL